MISEIYDLMALYLRSLMGITAGEALAAERMVTSDTFYQPVTNNEKRAAVATMATEFRDTGH